MAPTHPTLPLSPCTHHFLLAHFSLEIPKVYLANSADLNIVIMKTSQIPCYWK